jgi:hypothetical protein
MWERLYAVTGGHAGEVLGIRGVNALQHWVCNVGTALCRDRRRHQL